MRYKLILLFVLAVSLASAQQSNVFLNYQTYNFYEPALNKKDVYFHTAIRPYRLAEVEAVAPYDSVFQLKKLSGEKFPGRLWNWIAYDNILQVNQPDFHLTIDPLINFSGGYELEAGKGLYTNTRGLAITGDIGENKKFSFALTARENQAKFPDYVSSFVKKYQVIPGQGKSRSFKNNQSDYANATGYISYTPSKYVNFQLGHDKNFIGDGYRSMLLSDNALYYPFLKITTSVWRFKYMNLYAQFDDAINYLDGDTVNVVTGVTRKWGSFHYLSFDAWDWVQLGIFEGIIWPNNDTTLTRGFDVNYLNPIIFFRPIEFGLGSPDNAVLAANIKIKPINDLIFYGQFLLDDLDVAAARSGEGYYRNKFGIQAGAKYYLNMDANKHAFVFQAELDQANPYTYASKEPVQNYAHYNQALAHPLGANFREVIGIFTYRAFYRYYIDIKVQHAITGLDTTKFSNVGSNIFLSDYTIPLFPDSYGNEIGQGLKTTINSADIRVGYLLNPKINMNIEGQIYIRNYTNAEDNFPTKMIMLSLKTDLFNSYYDF